MHICAILMVLPLYGITIFMCYSLFSGNTQLPNSGKSRLALGFLWLVVLVILTSYSGTLTSYLAVDIRSLPFVSLEEVIQHPSYKIWMSIESVYAEWFDVSDFC